MITNGSGRLNRRSGRQDLCYNISKLNTSNVERGCLADERKAFHSFHYGRGSGHDVGCCVMAYHDSVGCTAQRVQCNSGPIFLGKPDCSDGILHHNSICPYFGGGRSAAEPAIPPARRPLGRLAERTSFCLSRLGGHFPFHNYFASKTKSRSSAGFIVSTRTQTTANFRRGERPLRQPWRPIRPVWLLRRPFFRQPL